MKILSKNLKKGELKVLTENQDDLWYLSTIIEPGDLVKGKTLRKIKIGDSEQRNTKAVRKPAFLTISVEKTDYSPELLKVLGTIVEGPDDIPKGSHHSFNIEINSAIAIIKEKWFRFQLDKLNESTITSIPNILICVFDRESALFALSKRKGFELLSSLKGEVAKKEERVKAKGGFFADIIKQIEEYDKRYSVNYIVIASPAFWKEDLVKLIKGDLKKKITLATCSSVDKGAINEVLKRPEVANVLKQDRSSKEIKLVDEILSEISKDGKAAYGFDEVKSAAETGAVRILLVTDKLIRDLREKEAYAALEAVMKLAEQNQGEIHIINSENSGGMKLDGLGGIAAILRYKLNF